MARILLITSDHLRHCYVANALAEKHEMVGIVAESKPAGNPASVENAHPLVRKYFQERNQAEEKYFGMYTRFPLHEEGILRLQWGQSNTQETFQWIRKANPDIVVLFGSCIIREPILSAYHGRIINMHLGLSPYYRGSSTNFWPLVRRLPECVGVTIHHAVLKVDGGAIIAQGRPEVKEGDFSHDFGCKTILKGAELLRTVVARLSRGSLAGVEQRTGGMLCRRDDFTVDALLQMQKNFESGMVEEFLMEREARVRRYPIVTFEDDTT